MLCFVPVFAVIYIRRLFFSVFVITERWDMGMYEVPLSMSGFGMVTMLVNFHMRGIKNSFQHPREECESNRAYVL